MIFYEKKYAEELLKNGFSSFMNYNDLVILAKYFKYIGKNKEQIKNDLISFCKKFTDNFNDVLYYDRIQAAINTASKSLLRLPLDIDITEDEFISIRDVEGYNKQKFLFVCLVVAKYTKYNNTYIRKTYSRKYENIFYVNESLASLFRMAKLNLRKQDKNTLLYELGQTGLLSCTRTGSLIVNFVNEDSPVEKTITNMEDILSFFEFQCDGCGNIIENPSNKKVLCDDCYAAKRRKQQSELIKNYRNKSNSSNL